MHLNKKKIDDSQKIWQKCHVKITGVGTIRRMTKQLLHKYYSGLKYKQEIFIFGSLKNIRKT